MNINEIISKANYVECGRDFPDVDCYGIVLHVRELLNLHSFPELGFARKVGGNIDEHGKPLSEKLSICEAEHGCIAACYDQHGMMTHTGIVIDNSGLMVIECNPLHNASCTSLSRFKRRFEKVKFFK